MKRLAITVLGAVALALAVVSPTFAHECENANKPAGAGSVGTYDVTTGEFTPSGQPNGGFMTVTDGTESAEVFIHGTLPEPAMNAGPGDDPCDGVGVDNALDCHPDWE